MDINNTVNKLPSYRPRHLLLQWHITERCNLRCRHCYQESYCTRELSFDDLLTILQQYRELLSTWRSENSGTRLPGHITVTGGEPFVRSDFLDLLQLFRRDRCLYSFAVLTNGTFIDRTMAKRLQRLGPSFVQVSLEGTRKTHDAIRGSGSFDRTVAAIKQLVRARIRTLISFTATRANYREFPQVAELAGRLRADRVWADRCIPCGSGSELADQLLGPEDTSEFVELMRQACLKRSRRWLGRTEVAMHRALQFLGGGPVYSCSAGDSLITVQPNGDLLPCRRMPIRVGNVLEVPLHMLYAESPLLARLRNKNQKISGCEDCAYSSVCRGGLKCLSYAVAGDPFAADPGCWLARETKDLVTLEKANHCASARQPPHIDKV